jgi:hypothetical protein
MGTQLLRPRKVEYRVIKTLLGCRFILLRELNSHSMMFTGLSSLEAIETTFRMGIKGGAHKLFSDTDPLLVGNVFIDGDEHYIGEFGRSFDINRTLVRFATERRPYVSFLAGPQLIPQRSDHRKIESHQLPSDSHLLQLCDILIGGSRFHILDDDPAHVRYDVSGPCRDLLQHDQENQARMKESRYFNGFSLSQCWLENGEWNFAPLQTRKKLSPKQFSLFG